MSTSSAAPSKPSLLRGLFHGDITDALLFPYPATLDERRPDEAATVTRLITSLNAMVTSGLIDPRQMDEDEAIGEPVIRAFADAGLLGLTTPKEYGGLGLSASAYARVFGAVASIDASLGVLIGVHCGLGGKALVLFGNDEQKARYLPALARGDMLAAYALTEPETGSDAQNIGAQRTQALDRQWPTRRDDCHVCANAHRTEWRDDHAPHGVYRAPGYAGIPH